jgi:hypothetical protein
MRIEMLTTLPISADGFSRKLHLAGEVIDLPGGLAASLIRDKHAKPAEAEPEADPKALEPAPEPKAESVPATPKKRYLLRGKPAGANEEDAQ